MKPRTGKKGSCCRGSHRVSAVELARESFPLFSEMLSEMEAMKAYPKVWDVWASIFPSDCPPQERLTQWIRDGRPDIEWHEEGRYWAGLMGVSPLHQKKIRPPFREITTAEYFRNLPSMLINVLLQSESTSRNRIHPHQPVVTVMKDLPQNTDLE